MSGKTLIVTVGIPRSGKSTWSRTTGYPMVNPDSFRLAIHGQPFIAEREDEVWEHVRVAVDALFIAGHDKVVLDATSITRKARTRLRTWQSQIQYKVVFKVFDTPKEICIERAKLSGTEYLIPVIERMSKAYHSLGKDEEVYEDQPYKK